MNSENKRRKKSFNKILYEFHVWILMSEQIEPICVLLGTGIQGRRYVSLKGQWYTV